MSKDIRPCILRSEENFRNPVIEKILEAKIKWQSNEFGSVAKS